MWPVPSEIIESRDWGRLPDYVAEKAVVIVVGTWEGAELFDRPLAYIVAEGLISKGFFAVVMSDVFILNVGKRIDRFISNRTPIITIGSSVANALTALIARETGIDPNSYVGIIEWRNTLVGLAYGSDPIKTREAVYRFLHQYLDEFVKNIKNRGKASFPPWISTEAKDLSEGSLTKLIEDLRRV